MTRTGEYEIIGAFYSQVYPDETQFDYYVDQVKKTSLYDTGKTAKYGDQLITLVTCSYHVTDGRFVVVARKADVLKDKAEQVRRATAAMSSATPTATIRYENRVTASAAASNGATQKLAGPGNKEEWGRLWKLNSVGPQ